MGNILSLEKINMQLSEHFTLNELTKSQTALRLGIDNTPNDEQIENLKALCENILEPVRDKYGPLTPSSGFRSIPLCEAIKSSAKSQHAKGEAADFEVMGTDNLKLATWIKERLMFDQLILEFYKDGDPNSGWVHCSFKKGDNRKEVLRFDGSRYSPDLK